MRSQIDKENPDAEPHSGVFSSEELLRVESRESELYDVKLKEQYDNAFLKAKFLIKLAIPRQF